MKQEPLNYEGFVAAVAYTCQPGNTGGANTGVSSSIFAKAAYDCGMEIHDPDFDNGPGAAPGRTFDYRYKAATITAGTILPNPQCPESWNSVPELAEAMYEARSNRWDARVSKTLMFTTPIGLSVPGMIRVAERLHEEVAPKSACIYGADNLPGNPHVQMNFSYHNVGEDGQFEKLRNNALNPRSWSDNAKRRGAEIAADELRKEAALCDDPARRAEMELKADRWEHGWKDKLEGQFDAALERGDLSYAEACLGENQTHMGPRASAMEKRGIETRVGNDNRRIRLANDSDLPLRDIEDTHPQPTHGGHDDEWSTGAQADRYLELCRDPMQDLQGFNDDRGRGEFDAKDVLPAGPRMDDNAEGRTKNQQLRPVAGERGPNPLAVAKARIEAISARLPDQPKNTLSPPHIKDDVWKISDEVWRSVQIHGINRLAATEFMLETGAIRPHENMTLKRYNNGKGEFLGARSAGEMRQLARGLIARQEDVKAGDFSRPWDKADTAIRPKDHDMKIETGASPGTGGKGGGMSAANDAGGAAEGIGEGGGEGEGGAAIMSLLEMPSATGGGKGSAEAAGNPFDDGKSISETMSEGGSGGSAETDTAPMYGSGQTAANYDDDEQGGYEMVAGDTSDIDAAMDDDAGRIAACSNDVKQFYEGYIALVRGYSGPAWPAQKKRDLIAQQMQAMQDRLAEIRGVRKEHYLAYWEKKRRQSRPVAIFNPSLQPRSNKDREGRTLWEFLAGLLPLAAFVASLLFKLATVPFMPFAFAIWSTNWKMTRRRENALMLAVGFVTVNAMWGVAYLVANLFGDYGLGDPVVREIGAAMHATATVSMVPIAYLIGRRRKAAMPDAESAKSGSCVAPTE